MRRRELITLLGGAAAAWPLAARAQQPGRMRRIGLLANIAESDDDTQAMIGVLRHRLQELGWSVGRNVQIDGSLERRRSWPPPKPRSRAHSTQAGRHFRCEHAGGRGAAARHGDGADRLCECE